ncbi:hypothetical protein ACFYOK_19940 [Microbispora bryophytorum]|uniref:hypothetical protein n=1 Tax=Microbispora bryophytorum TaxID=1460882 RepID=UPI0033CF14F2
MLSSSSRHLAKLGGLTLRDMRDQLVVSFAKVAEYQRRVDEDTVLVVSEWEYAGKGYSPGDALVAALTASSAVFGGGG